MPSIVYVGMESEDVSVLINDIGKRIFMIRGRRVMLDRDLAELYGVTTSNLNKAVKRNSDRFPVDFMFHLTTIEHRALRFQIGILEKGRHSKYSARAFTEQGVAQTLRTPSAGSARPLLSALRSLLGQQKRRKRQKRSAASGNSVIVIASRSGASNGLN